MGPESAFSLIQAGSASKRHLSQLSKGCRVNSVKSAAQIPFVNLKFGIPPLKTGLSLSNAVFNGL